MGIFGAVIDFIAKPVTNIIGGWQARKTAKYEHQLEIENAKQKFEVAKWQARSEREVVELTRDSDYDDKFLRNRDGTWTDELLIIIFMGLFICHFIPTMQPYMDRGWVAMDRAPAVFHFAIYGILISTLGLMRLFKLMFKLGKNNKNG